MANIQLFHMPGACSRVVVNALEEVGWSYEDHPIDLYNGEQKSEWYRKVNPKAKIPALLVDGELLTEIAAILPFLDACEPAARLLPAPENVLEKHRILSDLAWCSSTLHPLVRQVRNPATMTDGEAEPLRTKAIPMFEQAAVLAEERLISSGPWWYGDNWSILDVYLMWAYEGARRGGFDLTQHLTLMRHREMVRSRPSFARAVARETAAAERIGIQLPADY